MDTKNCKGSLTLEAAIVMPVFLIACLLMLLLIYGIKEYEAVEQSFYETVNELSYMEHRDSWKLNGLAMVRLNMKLKVKKQEIGMYWIESQIGSDGSFKATVHWHSQLPIVGSEPKHILLHSRMRTLGNRGLVDEQKYVYITKSGQYYHLENCQHLRSSSQMMTYEEAVRNGYSACWHCVGRLDPFEKAPKKPRPVLDP